MADTTLIKHLIYYLFIRILINKNMNNKNKKTFEKLPQHSCAGKESGGRERCSLFQ